MKKIVSGGPKRAIALPQAKGATLPKSEAEAHVSLNDDKHHSRG
jgi:hypothetical protein